jgi:chemotaxis protein methyltransferase CheR
VIAVAQELLVELAAILKARVGLHIRPDSFSALRLALSARLEGQDPPAADAAGYLGLLGSERGDDELRRLLPLVTVGKTNFFRDERQFRALQALLPGLVSRAKGGGDPVRIWSAGCATGEEPFSIAMTLAEAGAEPGHAELLATDVNPEAVAAAARGLYEARRAREIPAPLLAHHFDQEGDAWRVRASLRRYLRAIRPHNLVSAAFPDPEYGGWDLIFCRNVIIYFSQEARRELFDRYARIMAPDGYLYIGHSESIQDASDRFELVGRTIYRLRSPAR